MDTVFETPAQTPDTEEALAALVAEAKSPLAIEGGCTRGVSCRGERLSTTGLTGITLYEPGALTIVARAGTPLAEVEKTLAAEGQQLPFEPTNLSGLMGTLGQSTIGGVAATGSSGPRRVQAGACRDSLIGVRFVDGQGSVVQNGGRVMKNVTGYDLVKLMAGSYGTLGVLTEVSFKVLPRPAATATLVYEGLDWHLAGPVFSQALRSPFEVSGAARLPAGSFGKEGAVLIRLEGFADSVAYRSRALADRLEEEAGQPTEILREAEANAELWAKVRDVTPFAGGAGDVWRISVKPTDLDLVARHVALEETVLDWGGGLVWAQVPPGTDLRAALKGVRGHATLIRASEETRIQTPRFQPEPLALAKIASGLRKKFDPRGILNPGLMG